MAAQLLKDIKVQCVHPDKYYPKNITKKAWYEVVGVNSWNYNVVKDDKQKTESVIKLLIINDENKISQVDINNCHIVDVEKARRESKKSKYPATSTGAKGK